MSVQTPAARPTGTSVGAATVGLLLTLTLFVAAMMAFLLAPLALLGVALVGYAMARAPRDRTRSEGSAGRVGAAGPIGSAGTSNHGFGAGTR